MRRTPLRCPGMRWLGLRFVFLASGRSESARGTGEAGTAGEWPVSAIGATSKPVMPAFQPALPARLVVLDSPSPPLSTLPDHAHNWSRPLLPSPRTPCRRPRPGESHAARACGGSRCQLQRAGAPRIRAHPAQRPDPRKATGRSRRSGCSVYVRSGGGIRRHPAPLAATRHGTDRGARGEGGTSWTSDESGVMQRSRNQKTVRIPGLRPVTAGPSSTATPLSQWDCDAPPADPWRLSIHRVTPATHRIQSSESRPNVSIGLAAIVSIANRFDRRVYWRSAHEKQVAG